jgi:hypothetical protein
LARRSAIRSKNDPHHLPGTVVLLGTQLSALLEVHLGSPVPEVREDDGHDLVTVIAGLVGKSEREPLGLEDLSGAGVR